MLSTEARETLKDSILKAQTVEELEKPFKVLIAILGEQSSHLLSELWYTVILVRERIADIHSLKDLGDGSDQDEQNPRAKIGNWLGQLCEILARFDSHVIAANLLIELWNNIGEYQSTINQKAEVPWHSYRAGIGMYLGRILIQKDPGAAIWWLLHAQADDLLNRHPNKGGAAQMSSD